MSHYIFQVDEDPEKIQRVARIMKMNPEASTQFNKAVRHQTCYSPRLKKSIVKGVNYIHASHDFIDKNKLSQLEDDVVWYEEE